MHIKIRKRCRERKVDECTYAKLRAPWLRIAPPRKYSEEVLEKYRQGMKERFTA